jgi:hypothetical protein
VRRQTLFKISPNLARNVAFGKLEWFQNAPKVATNAQVFAAIAPFGLLVQPCLFRFGPSGARRAAQHTAPRCARLARKRARARSSPERRAPRPAGVFVDPQAIAISPRVLHVEATGVNISPAGISIGPILIAVTPSGTNIGLTHVAVRAAPFSLLQRPSPNPNPIPYGRPHRARLSARAHGAQVSPVFLDVAPTVRVVAGSGKPATFAKGIAVNAQPKPAVVTDARGKVVRPSPAVATTATSSSGSVASATGIAPPATGGG